MIYGLIIATMVFLHLQNNWIGITEYKVNNDKIDEQGVFIHLSDIHGKFMGDNGDKIIRKIRKYDIINGIFITGDLIDSRAYKEENAIKLIKGLIKIAPIFFVLGNHEVRRRETTLFLERLKGIGVIVLRNEKYELKLGNKFVNILGIDDPSSKKNNITKYEFIGINIFNLLKDNKNKNINILLSHRPEVFKLYATMEIDFVFAGHAHGGQVRIPFLGGILAPSEGFFPKYSEGIHKENKTNMIVSRGIGRSIFPFRIFNRPEIVVLKLNEQINIMESVKT